MLGQQKTAPARAVADQTSGLPPFPCAGMTQIRFVGSVADTATLSARLPGLP
ncbi:hypothetical protein ARMA_0185 [Ardenticatena maritima]|uniref:Uncharacterized protein n=1 Tax=Ardenticatena maritima TaxID=872965 RepID=A0A0M8K6J9_9CHLR|nr:hypothetical protein ARMA_0185 [Ardenticatena maritima]